MGNCISHVDGYQTSKFADRKRFVLYSDFTCPYCYLEFARLTRAMEKLPKEERLIISHGPFQLDDTLPCEGVDKYEFLSKLIPPFILDPMINILCSQFKELGMEMNPRGRMGNSAQAHYLQIWADEHCPPDQALALKDFLFKIHSCSGKSMADVDAILEAAAKAGLTDESKIRSILRDSKYASKLKRMNRHAKKDLDIQSVPCLMVINPSGEQRKLDKATTIESIDGFTDLIARHI